MYIYLSVFFDLKVAISTPPVVHLSLIFRQPLSPGLIVKGAELAVVPVLSRIVRLTLVPDNKIRCNV